MQEQVVAVLESATLDYTSFSWPIYMIMAEQAETTFVKTYLNAIINQPITYGNDYQQPLQNSLKRIPILPVRMHTLCRYFRIMGL